MRLQSVEQHLTIVWRTAVATASAAHISIPGVHEESRATTPAFQHRTQFGELTPGTTYQISVPGFQPRLISTLRDTPDRRFAFIGHTHGTEKMDHYPDSLLASILHQYRPDFVVHAGDAVYNSNPADWEKHFFSLFRPLCSNTPIYLAPGNHDSGWPFLEGYDLRAFKELFPHQFGDQCGPGPGQAYYSIKQGPARFFFLSYVADMGPEAPQVKWLKQELAQSQSAFNIASSAESVGLRWLRKLAHCMIEGRFSRIERPEAV